MTNEAQDENKQNKDSPEQAGKKKSNGVVIFLLFVVPFVIMPLAKCMEDSDGGRRPNPLSPSVQKSVNQQVSREMEKFDSIEMTPKEREAKNNEAFMRAYNAQKQ